MEFRITPEYDGKNVKYILRTVLGLSRACVMRIKYMPDGILLGGRRVTVRAEVRAGDVLTLALEDREEDVNEKVVPSDADPDILYEDGDCMVVNKPNGMPTHPTHGHLDDTLANVCVGYMRRRGEPFVFRPVNRLDRETSGAVLIAKNKHSAARLGREMLEKRIQKRYVALLHGLLPGDSGEISGYIARSGDSIIMRILNADGRESEWSLTRWKKLASDGEYTAAEAEPVTGRTHQIRLHFSSVGAPVAGDGLYGDGDLSLCGRLALHAHTLSFRTRDGEMVTAEAPLPPEMKAAIEKIGGNTGNG
ncbi:MAG: RluA family pseudouridine synthase [Clostridia bacterium]|nr:RluA family pseudouridine synthase [Clostridia bacterium]